MKSLIIAFSLFITTSVFSQSITNTLGTSGQFTIKDGFNNYLIVSEPTGQVNILKTLRLENTTTTGLGIIFKGADRFLHNFSWPGTNGSNTFLGINSGNFSMSGPGANASSFNTAVGENSLYSLTSGNSNTCIGYNSLLLNSSGSGNTSMGSQTMFSNSTGNLNTAIGYQSLYANTTGNENIAAGVYSLRFNTSGYYNAAYGNQSLYLNSTGFGNTAIGTLSMHSNSSGYYNTALGWNSLYSNTYGNENVAVGSVCLYLNTSGSNNTAMGYYSMYSNTTGNNNISIGYNSLYSNTNGSNNLAIGWESLYSNSSGVSNTALGTNSLNANTFGYQNTAVGLSSLALNTTGNNNTAIGWLSGVTITTGFNNSIIGYDAQASSGTVSNEITLGNGSIQYLRCNAQTITSLSDARDKKNIKELSLGLDFLMKVKPRQFNWDKREWYENNKSDGSKMSNVPSAGFISQELDEAQTNENADWLNLVLKENPDRLEATYGNLLPVMVKAIQELKAEKDELKNENNEMKQRLLSLEQTQNLLISKLEQLKSNDTEIKKVMSGVLK